MASAATSAKDGVLSYRVVRTSDAAQLKSLHDELFPIKYNDKFYEDACKNVGINGGELYCIVVMICDSSCDIVPTILSDQSNNGDGITSESATMKDNNSNVNDKMVGFILAQYLPATNCGDNDLFNSILYTLPEEVFYILTIGVISEYRCRSIGSTLLRMANEYALLNPKCGCVYLHVIDYNQAAMQFYQSNGFMPLKNCPEFYVIEKRYYTANLYIRYTHGYKYPLWYAPPLTIAGVSKQKRTIAQAPEAGSGSVADGYAASATSESLSSSSGGLIGNKIDPFQLSYVSLFTNVVRNLVDSLTDIYLTSRVTTSATTSATGVSTGCQVIPVVVSVKDESVHAVSS